MSALLLGVAGNGGVSRDGGVSLLAAIATLVVCLVFAIVVFNLFLVWMRAAAAGAKVTYIELIAMRLRRLLTLSCAWDWTPTQPLRFFP